MGGTECCKMTSFGVVELIQTCVASFVGPTMLGVMVLRDILAEMGGFSTFSCFWVKPTIVDRVSRADVIGNNASKFNEVGDGVDEEKLARFGEISFVE